MAIERDFPKANSLNIKFIAVGSIKVEIIGNDSALYIERQEGLSLKPFFSSKREEESKVVFSKSSNVIGSGDSHYLYSLCTNHNLYCDLNKYVLNIKNNTIKYITEYHIGYNCIGWALGVQTWINPVNTEGEMEINLSNINTLALLTAHFVQSEVKKAAKYNELGILKTDHLLKIVRVECNSLSSEKLEQEGVIAFYFNKYGMTHAARFVEFLEGVPINSWVSKLGHSILISHELDDLNDSIYGNHLCYGLTQNVTAEISI